MIVPNATGDSSVARPSDTVSHFLECMYYITEVDEVIRPSRLAAWLGIKAPTVTDTVRRLVRDGWVHVNGDRSLRLTAKGEEVGASIVRRHRILERWLVDVLGFDWATADVEAEGLAATVSEEVIDRIDRSLGSPVTCPHGNAIPGRSPHYGTLVALSNIARGERVSVRRVSEVAEHEAHSLLSNLGLMGIAEGTRIRVVSIADDKLSMNVLIGRQRHIISMPDADLIWVERGSADA